MIVSVKMKKMKYKASIHILYQCMYAFKMIWQLKILINTVFSQEMCQEITCKLHKYPYGKQLS